MATSTRPPKASPTTIKGSDPLSDGDSGLAVLAVGREGVCELRRGPRVAPRVLGRGRAALVPLQAGPLAGDRDAVRLRVGAGAELALEPIAATVAYPGAARTWLDLDVVV